MVKLNLNYRNIKQSYLFSEIASRVKAYTSANPDKPIIRMGIGDVTLPMVDNVVNAIKKAADEQLDKATFRGYGPELGYDFLREKISTYYKMKSM